MSKGKSYTHYDGKIAGLYDLGDTLGRGHFAVVKLAKHVFTGEQVAVKVIDKTKLDEVSRAHLFQEVRCMKLVQHPNVVRLYEVIDTQTKLYLILELGDGGDMYDYIMKHEKGVDEETAKKYFRQIVHAISYCHRLHVVHRDLKPENVVFFEKLGMVKLTDFGFSNKFCPGQKLETSCGSLAYSAPEILLGDSYDAPKVDVWSLGVILYMLVCGHAPFQEANDSETLTMIMDCKYTIPSHVSPVCVRLIEQMLIRDPDKRASLEEIANDPWLNCGDAIQPADYLPLVSREHLSDEDHAHIIQKMVNGSIATKEEIVEALDKNNYNHITATYFLLAERKLRAQRQEKAQLLNSRISRTDLSPIAVTPGISSAVPSPAQEKPTVGVESLVSPCLPSKPLEPRHFGSHLIPPGPLPTHPIISQNLTLPLVNMPLPLARKCSIVREEEDNSSTASASSSPTKSPLANKPKDGLGDLTEIAIRCLQNNQTNSSLMRAATVQRPVFTLPVCNNSAALSATQNKSKQLVGKLSGCSSLVSPKFKTLPPHGRRLHTVQSSPQLPLNEINEESENESGQICRRGSNKKHFYIGKLHSHSSVISHIMLKMMEQHHKFGKSRTSSCSSLEVSDEDIAKHKVDKSKQNSHDEKQVTVNVAEENISNSLDPENDIGLKHTESTARLDINSLGNGINCETGDDEERNSEEHRNISAFNHTVFSTDSTDSLDFLSETQPRLVNSMSCGDLTADVEHYTIQDKKVIHTDSISLTEIPQIVDENSYKVPQCIENQIDSTKAISQISNSFSLNTGLSTLQRVQNLTEISIESITQESDKNSRVIGLDLTKLVQSTDRSSAKNQLDINQNGWKNNQRKASNTRASGSDQQAVVDMKMASKCCTLC